MVGIYNLVSVSPRSYYNSYFILMQGMKKHELLQQVLQVVGGANVKLQRLCTEFQQQLNMINELASQ